MPVVAADYFSCKQFRILFLDKRNQLIADEVQQTGTVDHTPVYPREVVKRALELSATAIILVHNHPSGDPRAWIARSAALDEQASVQTKVKRPQLSPGPLGQHSLRNYLFLRRFVFFAAFAFFAFFAMTTSMFGVGESDFYRLHNHNFAACPVMHSEVDWPFDRPRRHREDQRSASRP